MDPRFQKCAMCSAHCILEMLRLIVPNFCHNGRERFVESSPFEESVISGESSVIVVNLRKVL